MIEAKDPDPDPYLVLMDPGGLKTYHTGTDQDPQNYFEQWRKLGLDRGHFFRFQYLLFLHENYVVKKCYC